MPVSNQTENLLTQCFAFGLFYLSFRLLALERFLFLAALSILKSVR